jgi:hypothetical protein
VGRGDRGKYVARILFADNLEISQHKKQQLADGERM